MIWCSIVHGLKTKYKFPSASLVLEIPSLVCQNLWLFLALCSWSTHFTHMFTLSTQEWMGTWYGLGAVKGAVTVWSQVNSIAADEQRHLDTRLINLHPFFHPFLGVCRAPEDLLWLLHVRRERAEEGSRARDDGPFPPVSHTGGKWVSGYLLYRLPIIIEHITSDQPAGTNMQN